MKIGLNLFSIRNLTQNKKDLTSTLMRLKKEGCDFAQFSASPVSFKDLKEVIKKSKMPITLTHVPYLRVINDVSEVIKDHKLINCSYVGVGMFDKDLYLNEKKLKEVIKKLNISAKKLSKFNMKFFYHNHAWDFLKLSSGETIYEYMIKHAPYFHFTFDIYWAQYAGVDIFDTLNKLKGRVECVHLKDYMVNKDYVPEFAPLGDGNIDLKKVVNVAKKMGCKYFFIEQDNAAIKKNGFNDVVKSIKYIKENF